MTNTNNKKEDWRKKFDSLISDPFPFGDSYYFDLDAVKDFISSLLELQKKEMAESIDKVFVTWLNEPGIMNKEDVLNLISRIKNLIQSQ